MKLTTLTEAKYNVDHYSKPQFNKLSIKQIVGMFYEPQYEEGSQTGAFKIKKGLKATVSTDSGNKSASWIYGDPNAKRKTWNWVIYSNEREYEIDPLDIEIYQALVVYKRL